MIRLGVNSVLFGGFDFETAAKHIRLAGYDYVEVSAIKGMCEHLDLDNWRAQAPEVRRIVADNGLEVISSEVASLEEDRLTKAFEACSELGIPVVNIGPGGTRDVEEDFQRQTDLMAKMAEKAEGYGITLCVKAHVGASIYSTATTLRVMDKIKSPAFGIDMDPSHIYRGGENPEDALPAVLSRVRHIHIRDCKGRGPSPGAPADQACGRGDINLFGYCKAMIEGGYDGPVSFEVIGAGELSLPEVSIIAAQTRGYLNAVFRAVAG